MQEHELISCCSHMTLTSGLEHVRAPWHYYLLFHPQWAFFSIFLIFNWIWFVQVHSECDHTAMQSYPALSFQTTVSRYTFSFGNSGPNAGSCMRPRWEQTPDACLSTLLKGCDNLCLKSFTGNENKPTQYTAGKKLYPNKSKESWLLFQIHTYVFWVNPERLNWNSAAPTVHVIVI